MSVHREGRFHRVKCLYWRLEQYRSALLANLSRILISRSVWSSRRRRRPPSYKRDDCDYRHFFTHLHIYYCRGPQGRIFYLATLIHGRRLKRLELPGPEPLISWIPSGSSTFLTVKLASNEVDAAQTYSKLSIHLTIDTVGTTRWFMCINSFVVRRPSKRRSPSKKIYCMSEANRQYTFLSRRRNRKQARRPRTGEAKRRTKTATDSISSNI